MEACVKHFQEGSFSHCTLQFHYLPDSSDVGVYIMFWLFRDVSIA